MMNNSTLVNNTDRIYGEDAPLKKLPNEGFVDNESELSIWIKIVALLLGTYGLIVAFYALSGAIEMNSGSTTAFVEGGAIMLSIFLAYGIVVGFLWYKGAGKRDDMIREAVEEQLRREREE